MVETLKYKARLYLENHLDEGVALEVKDARTHYLTNVIRASIGDRLACFNGKSGLWLCEVTNITKKVVVLKVLELLQPQSSATRLSLFFAPIKAESGNYLVHKATELGVTDIFPILTERSVVKSVNHTKLKLSAIEASEQCERLDIPVIHEMRLLHLIFNEKLFTGNLIFCCERYDGSGIRNRLADLNKSDNAILVGPEGGFSPIENNMIMSQQNVLPVSLGKRILRAETALVSAIAVYQAIVGDW